MALIGEMKYLQIGGNTYEIPTDELPIASSSTLGGIKVGTNLEIDSSTGVLSVTGIPTISITRNLTSGTEIGTISINGAATKLYAPTPQDITVDDELSTTSENPVQNKVITTALNAKYTKPSTGIPASDLASGVIPTVPSAATTSPKMDGTAAVGSSSKYAKEDHVHPTDTSRQATLVSGTNIKTINSTSLLGSGNIAITGLPSVTTSDNGKFLRVVSGAWAAQTVETLDGGTW